MVAALAPGGVAVIFDNEADSRFGRRMALRKLVTRYSGLPLVPRYYCNAAYPPLARIQKQIAESAMMVSEIVIRRSEEHTSELQSLMRISYAVFCLKKKNTNITYPNDNKYVRYEQKT